MAFLNFRTQKKDLKVIVGHTVQCRLGDKAKSISVTSGSEVEFRKDGTNLIMVWPNT